MVEFQLKLFTWVYLWISILVVVETCLGCLWCPHHFTRMTPRTFEKKTDRFWEFDTESNRWIEVDLPFDLLSCVNGNCTKVGSIDRAPKKGEDGMLQGSQGGSPERKSCDGAKEDDMVLNTRRRISLTLMSETSIWVTGESGSIYERFWNGFQWIIAPHDLPVSAGPAVSVFLINQTILALSEAGSLYQLQLTESSQLFWADYPITYESSTHTNETDSRSPMQIKSGVVSLDGKRAYFLTMNGSLVELAETESLRWIYHGHPPGGDVVAITDATSITPDVVFTVSSIGNLYEFDTSSKPSWKKHIQSKGLRNDRILTPSKGCILYDLVGPRSKSLFLITKTGKLIERRLYQRKWRWIAHKGPKEDHLDSIITVDQHELTNKIISLFFTTTTGSIHEYRLLKHSGAAQDTEVRETWVNHMHPLHAKAARGIPGMQIQIGRILFALDDGRLAELHLLGIGGEGSPPTQLINFRRKAALKYEWSVLDAPESEGWNAEYCTEERGPSNCITGMRDEANSLDSPRTSKIKAGQSHESYLAPSTLYSSLNKVGDQNMSLTNGVDSSFRMRVMQEGRSFFFLTENGSTFEYLSAENQWLCLRHEHSTVMKGLLGNYNGSLFVVDTDGNLLIRERNGNELAWINGTALRKGRQVIGGPPWDRMPGKTQKVTAEDALFFVSKTGRLVQFTVALRNFRWKDCSRPPNTKIAYIIDQLFRDNIVFTVGRNGRLYQYNKVTELWHEHLQSPHMILSRIPGTAMRQSTLSLTGSIFMATEDGALVEYQWKALDGWKWVEHGTPYKGITLVGAPGPCLGYNELILIGSDGEVYTRYMDQRTWKWKSYGYPSIKDMVDIDNKITREQDRKINNCYSDGTVDSFDTNAQYLNDYRKFCDSKVASVRPISFSEDILIFELRDGRLAELKRMDDMIWLWSSIIGTPTSLCPAIHRAT